MTDELLSQVTQADIFSAGLTFPGEPSPDPEMYERLMGTQHGLELVRSLIESRSGGFFLLKPGDYRIGETVEEILITPMAFFPLGPRLMLLAHAAYTLRDVSGETARFDIRVTEESEGVYEAVRAFEEAVAIAFQSEFTYPLADDAEFQYLLNGYLDFTEPRLIHLEVDTGTGWPLSAQWTESYSFSEVPGEPGPRTSIDVTYTATFE